MSDLVAPIAPGAEPPPGTPADTTMGAPVALVHTARMAGELVRLEAELAEARAEAKRYRELYTEAGRGVSRMTDVLKGVEAERDHYRVRTGFLLGERSRCVALAASLARALGMMAGVINDGGTFEWSRHVVIGLPTGQVSWPLHSSEAPLVSMLPDIPGGRDGASEAEIYRRVAEFVGSGVVGATTRPAVPSTAAPRSSTAEQAPRGASARRPPDDWADDVDGVEVDLSVPGRRG